MLAAAAGRHLSARVLLLDLLTSRPTLTRHASTPVITTVIAYATHTQATTIYAALPRYSTELLRPACDLAHHITTGLPVDTPPATRAHHLNNLGNRLSEVGTNGPRWNPPARPPVSTVLWPRPNPPPTYPTSPCLSGDMPGSEKHTASN